MQATSHPEVNSSPSLLDAIAEISLPKNLHQSAGIGTSIVSRYAESTNGLRRTSAVSR
jgi:hypothetical protein